VPVPCQRLARAVLLAATTLAFDAGEALAQKTDVVVLVNGDTLTCEIKLLDRGRLQVSTDHLGTVNIEWDKVVSVTSSRIFRVETATGLRLLGRLATSEAAHLDVVQETGTVSVSQPDVVSIVPIGRSFWSRVDGGVNVGLSYTQSSGIAQLNVGANALHRRPNGQLTMSYSSFFTADADGENTSRHAADIGLARYVLTRSVWLLQGGGMRNQELGYDFRGTLSGGIGRFLVHSNRAIFVLGGGLSTSTETSVEGNTTQQLEALVVLRQSYFTYDSPKTDIATSINLYPSLSDWGRVRIEFDGRINREIVKDFTIGFSLYDSYDSRPPTEGARKNDVGLSLTLGWTF
jgi:putative salt-induced outer membrane protein YdiY